MGVTLNMIQHVHEISTTYTSSTVVISDKQSVSCVCLSTICTCSNGEFTECNTACAVDPVFLLIRIFDAIRNTPLIVTLLKTFVATNFVCAASYTNIDPFANPPCDVSVKSTSDRPPMNRHHHLLLHELLLEPIDPRILILPLECYSSSTFTELSKTSSLLTCSRSNNDIIYISTAFIAAVTALPRDNWICPAVAGVTQQSP